MNWRFIIIAFQTWRFITVRSLCITPSRTRNSYKFFKEEGERCFENRIELPNGIGSISVLTLSVNLVHQMVHISHHWYMEGIGLRLRQLMDYYFLLLNTNDCKIIFMA